ncbi:MAG: efflux RND transporter periplasmic adaptor subunit [Burkholderiales bacterium]|nr:efflux RND transporter periplasmic adaptor subunit [Burkholderiales bacterium]MBI3729093.1 efflux RND transporter periplasmic adaptor subunit [Burkholderiales bacterium]
MKQVLTILIILFAAASATVTASAAELEVAAVRSSNAASQITTDGVVEAVRQTIIAAQVSGAVTNLPVKAGDSMKAGQMLVRIDGRAANQQAHASQAQADAARAALQVASKDYGRQKQLFAQQYISQAQLDRAEAQFKSATADANAQIAQAGAVQTQSGFYALTAPYAGRIADVYISNGDMVTPGKALMAVYDPAALRVTATLPEALLANLAQGQTITIEIPALPVAQRIIKLNKFIVLPVTDASTHTVQLRLDLPAVYGLAPGMFARLQLPVRAAGKDDVARLYVPAKAVLRRAELYAVYVVNSQGRPMLRQIKPGPISGGEQEVLAGVAAGEKVALNPVAAAQSR